MESNVFNNMSVASDLTGLMAAYGERFGVDPAVIDAALASAGVSPSASSATTGVGRMPYAQWCAALEALYERTGDRALGLHIAESIQPAHCGVLGYLVLSSRTLGEALAQFERYQRLLYGGSAGQAAVDGDSLRFIWPQHTRSVGVGLSDETLVYGLIYFVRILVGSSLSDQEIDDWLKQVSLAFVHQPTASPAEYQQHRLGSIQFGSGHLSISMPVAGLALPVSNSDPALFQLLNQQAEALLKVLPDERDEFDRQVRDYLRRALPDGCPTLDGLARELAMSSRTVHRRLAERGMNFAALLRQTREELARQYLSEGRISLSEVAFLLGYSEQSAFSRAFRQWTGSTPRQFLVTQQSS